MCGEGTGRSTLSRFSRMTCTDLAQRVPCRTRSEVRSSAGPGLPPPEPPPPLGLSDTSLSFAGLRRAVPLPLCGTLVQDLARPPECVTVVHSAQFRLPPCPDTGCGLPAIFCPARRCLEGVRMWNCMSAEVCLDTPDGIAGLHHGPPMPDWAATGRGVSRREIR